MSAALITAVYDWLAADTGVGGFAETTVSNAVGTRLFHVTGPEDVSLAAGAVCVFTIASAAGIDRGFDGSQTETWRMAFSIWIATELATSSGPAAALGVDAKLRTRLDGQRLTATGYDRALVRVVSAGACVIDEDAYRVDSEYTITATR